MNMLAQRCVKINTKNVTVLRYNLKTI